MYNYDIYNINIFPVLQKTDFNSLKAELEQIKLLIDSQEKRISVLEANLETK